MTLALPPLTPVPAAAGIPAGPSLRAFTVDEYHRMVESGVLTENDAVELVEGWVLHKMPKGPLHDAVVDRVRECLSRVLPLTWRVRVQSAITTATSEPEPDLAVARGPAERYFARHPGPEDLALVVEVAESSLMFDRDEKSRMYARAGVQNYWIINLKDNSVEVYADPSGDVTDPSYGSKSVHRRGDSIRLPLAESPAIIPASDLLP